MRKNDGMDMLPVSLIDWRERLPGYVFLRKRPDKVFFIDSDVLYDEGFLGALLDFTFSKYKGIVLVSLGCERDSGACPADGFFAIDDISKIGRPAHSWQENAPDFMDKISVLADSTGHWVIYGDGLESIAVLALWDEGSNSGRGVEFAWLDDYSFDAKGIADAIADPDSELLIGLNRDFAEDLFANYV